MTMRCGAEGLSCANHYVFTEQKYVKTKESLIRQFGPLKFPRTVKQVESVKFLSVLGKNVASIIVCTFTDTVQFKLSGT